MRLEARSLLAVAACAFAALAAVAIGAWATRLEWAATGLTARADAVAAHADRLARVRALQPLIAELDGGYPAHAAPAYWDAASRAYLMAANDLAITRADQHVYLDRAEQAVRASLRINPARQGPWSRLAAIDAARHGALSADGVRAFDHVRAFAPYDPDVTLWRVGFTVQNWNALSREHHDRALHDIAFLLRDGDPRGYRGDLRRLLNPAPDHVRAYIARGAPALELHAHGLRGTG